MEEKNVLAVFSPPSSGPESSVSSRIFTAIRQGNGLQPGELCWTGKKNQEAEFYELVLEIFVL